MRCKLSIISPAYQEEEAMAMSRRVKKVVRWLFAAAVCFAFLAHCGNVTISKKIAAQGVPGVGYETKLG